MRLLLDMGVSVRVVEALRGDGHDVHHLSQLGLSELKDRSVFDLAIAEDRVIVTFDLDFGEFAAFASGPIASVLSMRLEGQTAENVLRRLRATIATCREALSTGAIVCVEQTRCRIRRYPIRSE